MAKFNGWTLNVPFAGGEDPESAHELDSVLNLTGQIFLGLVGPDGTAVEQAITPTLAVIGTPKIDIQRRLVLAMAADDEAVLGAAEELVTVDQLRRSVLLEDGLSASIGGDSRYATSAIFTSDWFEISQRIEENTGVVVPWGYGVSPIPLIRIGRRHFIACLVRHEPVISDRWELAIEEWTRNSRKIREVKPQLWTSQVRATIAPGATVDAWVIGVTILGDAGAEDDVLDEPWYLTPPPDTRLGMPPTRRATPTAILRQMVEDLSEVGSAAIDEQSFARTDAEVPVDYACGGLVRSGTTISELSKWIVDPWGIALWFGTDNRLRALRPAAWGAADAALAAGDLPEIRISDIAEGSFSVRQPSPDEVGGASVRTSIDWTSEQSDFYLPQQLLRHAPGATRLALSGEPETRMSGAWLHPLAAETALQSVGSRRAFVYTRIEAGVAPWILGYELGQLFRLSHPWGPKEGGYQRQLVRLIRMEHQPGDDFVMCSFLDFGALELMRAGKLDSAANWVFYDPGESAETIEFTNGSAVVACSDPALSEDWTGRSLWTFGASNPALRRSWRIGKVELGAGTFEVDQAATASEVIAADGADPHRAAWVVMRNRKEDPSHRTEYITLADEDTGLHSDGSPGYRLMS